MQIGQVYETRGHGQVTVINDRSSDKYPITVVDNKKKLIKLTKEGHFIGPGYPHAKDVIKRV